MTHIINVCLICITIILLCYLGYVCRKNKIEHEKYNKMRDAIFNIIKHSKIKDKGIDIDNAIENIINDNITFSYIDGFQEMD